MVNILPITSSQTIKVRTSKPCDVYPLSLKVVYNNIESNEETVSYNVTGSYDSFNFLNLETSFNIPYNVNHTIKIVQLSSSVECCTLYRGEIYSLTSSVNTRNSEPFISYVNDNENIWILPKE
jgi:hypothetical protein